MRSVPDAAGRRPLTLVSLSTLDCEGKARSGRRTKELVKGLKRGEVAVIRHADLDSVAARSLCACQPALVVNASDSITGRYPNSGPSLLMEAGIPLVDCVGDDVFERIQDGDRLRLAGDALYLNDEKLETGRRITPEKLERLLEAGRNNVVHELKGFAENTLRYLTEESSALLEPMTVPDTKTSMANRHVVVVARGEEYRNDLLQILPYIKEQHPALLAVDGSADALMDLGLQPDIIFGDMDSVSDRALRSGAELMVHAYSNGYAPGLKRVRDLGRDAILFPVPGTSEDAAMLLAYEHGAKMIVAVGTHFSMVDFLDKGRAGMASTFLVRLKVGSILVDAKGVSRLYRPSSRLYEVAMLVFAALVPIATIFMLSPKLHGWLQLIRLYLSFWRHLR